MSAQGANRDYLHMNCSRCGQPVRWPRERPLPARLRCPSCREAFEPNVPKVVPPLPPAVPRTAPEVPPVEEPATGVYEVVAGAEGEREKTATGTREAIIYPAEPWYYGYLALSGRILAVICLVGLAIALTLFLLGLCLSVYQAFADEDPLSPGFWPVLAASFVAWFSYLVFALTVSFSSFFTSAMLLLLVDVARNIRWQRLLIESRSAS